MGAAGLGLGLLAAVSTKEPSWDRLLLASGKQDFNAAMARQ
jgi:hypothetical protein